MEYKVIINKKNNKQMLTYNEIKYMVNAYVSGELSDEEMTLFIKAIYKNSLSFNETLYLTDVMIKSGKTIDLSELKKVSADKHSTGGIGDKTSLIILPICAALNIAVPKMSGKSLGITGGTIDKLESIPGFKSKLTHKEFIDILNDVGCVDICQSKDIAIADKKIYALRDRTGYVDSIPLIASSIMSKKIACSSKNIVIDLKVGKGAFMKNIKSATKLAKLMIKIGNYYNRKVICVLTDMSTPLGSNIGNILEVREAINYFDKKYDKRLNDIVVTLSSQMVSISKNISYNMAKKMVINTINNGMAKDKFYKWINSQHGDIDKMKMNARRIDVRSNKKGYINEIDADIIGTLATDLSKINNKLDPSTGIVLRKKIGDFVEKDEVLASIYYNKEVNNMISLLTNAYKIEDRKLKVKNIILKVIK